MKHPDADARCVVLLDEKPSPERRAVLIGALSRLQPNNTAAFERLKRELDNDRSNVRRVAIDAIAAIGDPSAVNVLLEKRAKEESPRMIRAFDSAIEKLRSKERSLDQLQRELSELRNQNKQLEERLKALEQKK